MRHLFKFDGAEAIDVGAAVSTQQSKYALKDFGENLGDFLQRYLSYFVEEAFEIVTERYLADFKDLTADEAFSELVTVCGSAYGVSDTPTNDWRTGDVTRIEIIVNSPEVQRAYRRKYPQEFGNEVLTECIRNIYRRLHALENPVVLQAFKVFTQATVPTQVPLSMLKRVAKKETIQNEEYITLMKMRPEFWKQELLDITSAKIGVIPIDPDSKTMAISTAYVGIKSFFEPE